MKLKVLVDNYCYIDNYYLGEPALSFYLEDENLKILFDTGYSDVFLKNASKMNIDLNNLDYLVLSHGHNDHTGGIKYLNLKNSSIICHPNLFDYRKNDGLDIGCPIKENEIKSKKIIKTKSLYQISNNLYYLGEIKRIFEFEKRTVGYLKDNSLDKVIDDSALAYKTKEGLFIITGCSHSGIANICENAKELLNDNRIIGIIGGFHMFNDDNQIDNTIKYFKDNEIKDLYPCHCVSLYAKAKMYKELNVHEVGVGLEINIKGEKDEI